MSSSVPPGADGSWAVVDDRDPSIQFSTSDVWLAPQAVDGEFNHTATSTYVQGASAYFAFNGTRVAVFGSIVTNPNVASGTGWLSMFTIDDVEPETLVPMPDSTKGTDTFNQAFFISPLLADGEHSLNITLGTPDDAHAFRIDYLLYQPSQVNMSSSVQFIIDDSDAQVSYVGDWQPGGSDRNFNGTFQRPPSPGGIAELKFNGSAIDVFGTVEAANADSSNSSSPTGFEFSIDGEPPTSSDSSAAASGATFGQKIFNASGLSDAEHTLVVTASNGGNQLSLDYFMITPANAANASLEPPAQPSPSAPATSTTGSAVPTAATTDAPASLSQTSHFIPRKVLIGALAGGIGGLVLLLLLIFAIILCRRRKRPSNGRPSSPFSREKALVAALERPYDPEYMKPKSRRPSLSSGLTRSQSTSTAASGIKRSASVKSMSLPVLPHLPRQTEINEGDFDLVMLRGAELRMPKFSLDEGRL